MATGPTDDLFDFAPCGLLSFTDEGTLVVVNDTLLGLLGYSRDELVGGHVDRILTLASRLFYQTHFFPLLRMQGKAEEISLSLSSKSRESVPVLVSAVRRERQGTIVNDCALLPVRERGKYEDELLRAKRAAEEALRSNEELIQARQELQLRAQELDQQLHQLERNNQELTRISTILAHDLREPMRKLSVFGSLFTKEDRQVLSLTGQRSLDRIRAESARMDGLLTALQQFVSLEVTEEPTEAVNLNDVVRSAQQMVSERTERGAPKVLSQSLPVIQGRRRQLVMLFYHLLDNAVKFRTPEVFPQVDIGCGVIQLNSFRAIKDKYRYVDFARIVLEDNGVGFHGRYSDYVFEALRKLDPNTPGPGIGLAICRKVVESHGGSISAESEPGRGARFTILLPLGQ
ncbi:PAS domain-containing protein [Archangium violaceum]|uniref:sensor histidine kinase n=1 Tax=Archangium violaceum TaxID=83451 RepID=UPI00195227E2|nr:ATP-binding protein [Archangium violaceum]QRN94618.1 PAS domain-containing protein [Archangium violaceum]